MADLFDALNQPPSPSAPLPPSQKKAAPERTRNGSYDAEDVDILEGLEPVRLRPGMYVGGTDERAFHHLAAEVLDNAMDEAIAGHASRITLSLESGGAVVVEDNGRGIPVDPHPKRPDKSALEVIATTLHAGSKFKNQTYQTSGGLHGVGLSVVNALSARLDIEVARKGQLYAQSYQQGEPTGPLEERGQVSNRRGTRIRFVPDPEIFGSKLRFRPEKLFEMLRSKAFLKAGVDVRWHCAPECLGESSPVPEQARFLFPNGLRDFLAEVLSDSDKLFSPIFCGEAEIDKEGTRLEWALAFLNESGEARLSSFCNSVPTPEGGTHEQGLRQGLVKALRQHGELVGTRKMEKVNADDLMMASWGLLSLFMPDPQFVGQTKERLSSPQASRQVEATLKDYFAHWLAGQPAEAKILLESALARSEERLRRKNDRETQRKSATRKLRLPGKLADCSRRAREDSEIFMVEGDSAGGSAKQARIRETQAVLPLRGKILNVASATAEKQRQNQELSDLTLALGCGRGKDFSLDKLRYEKVIIMTDADVDGAHIASLLMTFFFREMRGLIEAGHLFMAEPPLFRLSQGGKILYARDEADKTRLLQEEFRANAKVDISRFKGLGEMSARQLKETTMDPNTRRLLRISLEEAGRESLLQEGEGSKGRESSEELVENLMGKMPEKRFAFIQSNAPDLDELDV